MERKYFTEYENDILDIDDIDYIGLMDRFSGVEIKEIERTENNLKVDIAIEDMNIFANGFDINKSLFNNESSINLNLASNLKEIMKDDLISAADMATLSPVAMIMVFFTAFMFTVVSMLFSDLPFLSSYVLNVIAFILIYLGYYFVIDRGNLIDGNYYNALILYITCKINDIYFYSNVCRDKKNEMFDNFDDE